MKVRMGTSYTAAQLLAMSLNTDSTTSDYVDEDVADMMMLM